MLLKKALINENVGETILSTVEYTVIERKLVNKLKSLGDLVKGLILYGSIAKGDGYYIPGESDIDFYLVVTGEDLLETYDKISQVVEEFRMEPLFAPLLDLRVVEETETVPKSYDALGTLLALGASQGKALLGENVLADKQALLRKNIQIVSADRGGDVTFHGPGQLIAWPVFDLRFHKRDIHFFLRKLEEVMVGTLADLGIKCETIPGKTGIGVGNKKISSIGIGISGWVSFHGISLNIEPEDEYFSLIRPCGMDIETTCIRKQTSRNFSLDDINHLLIDNFKKIFLKEKQIEPR